MSDEKPVEHNEIVAAAKDAKARREQAKVREDRVKAERRGWAIGAIGLGVGSAAVAAAVLYANRDRRHRDDD